jgi:hypothetical protein
MVSLLALDQFEARYGYRITNAFVCSYAKELVDIVHSYGKKTSVFYDDSWVGMEPQSEAFQTIGFDGIIKCVFSGFEVRLCSAVPGGLTHELRLHPYLFSVGLGGAGGRLIPRSTGYTSGEQCLGPLLTASA